MNEITIRRADLHLSMMLVTGATWEEKADAIMALIREVANAR